jgi:pimeloyl-ACP methyl ester carboxylesterase
MADSKSEALPIVLIAGLNCSARLYAEQIPALWQFGPVVVADHTRDDSMAAMARRILADAPPRFALAGLSMGGYIAFEIMRQAAGRVAKLALLDTGARAEVPERTAQRKPLMALATSGRFMDIFYSQYPTLVHRSRHSDAALAASVRAMNEETGPQAYLRQQQAIITRPDSRSGLAAIACPTLVLVGDSDEPTPPDLAREMAAGIPGALLVVVPECGHLSTMERPAAVNAALVEWMQSR